MTNPVAAMQDSLEKAVSADEAQDGPRTEASEGEKVFVTGLRTVDGRALHIFADGTWEKVDPESGEILEEGRGPGLPGEQLPALDVVVGGEEPAKVLVDGREIEVSEPWYQELMRGLAALNAATRLAGAYGVRIKFSYGVEAAK